MDKQNQDQPQSSQGQSQDQYTSGTPVVDTSLESMEPAGSDYDMRPTKTDQGDRKE